MNSSRAPKMPSIGTPDHVLATLLSLGLWIEIIQLHDSSRQTFTAAIRRLRSRGWIIRERVVFGPGREFNAPVYALDGSPSCDLRDADGLVPIITLYDSTSRGSTRRP